jgi:hypothetical protein
MSERRAKIDPERDRDLCADCKHEQFQHNGGLGMCSSYAHGYFCRCNQFRRQKSSKKMSKKR